MTAVTANNTIASTVSVSSATDSGGAVSAVSPSATTNRERERSYILKKRASDADFLPRPSTVTNTTGRAAGKSTVKHEHWNLLSWPAVKSITFGGGAGNDSAPATAAVSVAGTAVQPFTPTTTATTAVSGGVLTSPIAAAGKPSTREGSALLSATGQPIATVTYGHSLLSWDNAGSDRPRITAASLREKARQKAAAQKAPVAAVAPVAVVDRPRSAKAKPQPKQSQPPVPVPVTTPAPLPAVAVSVSVRPISASHRTARSSTLTATTINTGRSAAPVVPSARPVSAGGGPKVSAAAVAAARAQRVDIASGLGYGRKHAAHYVYLSPYQNQPLTAEQIALSEKEAAAERVPRNQFAAATGYGHWHSNFYSRFHSRDILHSKQLHELSFN